MIALPGKDAAADHWGTNTADTGANPDGSVHSYCWGAGFDADLQDNANEAMGTALDAATEAVAAFDSVCDTSGGGQTDVRWADADLPGTRKGQAPCSVFWSGSIQCDRFQVTLDPAQIDQGSNDEIDRSSVSCHEAGHTVGLTHGSGGGVGGQDDCMHSWLSPGTGLTYVRYSVHHREHINAWF
jgi:hypothetical protein